VKISPFIFTLGLMLAFPLYAEEAKKNNSALQENILQLLVSQPQKKFHFVQEKKLAMLNKPLITEGELLLKEDNVVIWDIQKPYAIRYELHRNFIKETDANGERTISPGTNPLAAALTEAMMAIFSGHWENQENLAHLSADGTIAKWKLDVTPRSTDLQKLIQHITVDGSTNAITQINIIESNNDSTVIHLTAAP